MAFAQIVECDTSNLEDIKRIEREWEEATEGVRTARRVALCRDRDQPDHLFEMVFFDSYESAMENSQLPQTEEYAKKMREATKGEPTFHNLEVIEDRTLS
jgi:hypothetical protein